MSGNCEGHEWMSYKRALFEWLFGAGYALVGLLSIVGNATVIFIVVSKKEMQTVTNFLIANLAVSDLIITLTSLWVTPAYLFNNYDWIWGKFMCYSSITASGISIIISTFTLTAIAIDRYLLVLHPFSSLSVRPRMFFAWIAIVVIWIAACLMVAPTVYHLTHVERHQPFCPQNITVCYENEWNKDAKLAYGLLILVLRSLIPFAIIALCYTKITLRLKDMNKRLKGRKRSNFRQEYDHYRKTRGLQRILIAMVVLFVVCSSPLDLINLLADIGQALRVDSNSTAGNTGYLEEGPANSTLVGPASTGYDWVMIPQWLRLLSHFIHMTGTIWNPILYAYGNENFKKEINRRLSLGTTGANQNAAGGHSPQRTGERACSSPMYAQCTHDPHYELDEMQTFLRKDQRPSAASIHL